LQFRVDIRETGEKVFAWRDLSGSAGDLWEFVCDRSTKPETVEAFELVALRCQYERKHRKSAEEATEKELQQFSFQDEPIPTASPLLSPVHSHSRSPTISPSPTRSRLHQPEASAEEVTMPAAESTSSKAPAATANSSAIRHPEGRETLTREIAELHLYNFEDGSFHEQAKVVEAVILDLGKFDYWLKVTSPNQSWIGTPATEDMSPVFNFEFLSAIFNVADKDCTLHSWLLRFKDTASIERFQQGLMQALWEHTNQMKWIKLKETDQDYVLDSFRDLTMEDQEGEEEPEEEDEEDEEEEEDVGVRSEEYDSDESADEVVTRPQDGTVNSQLAVGYKHDRSFVVRGSKIGVFKHTPDNHLEFATNISKVATPKGKIFSPDKVMLHASDKNLVLKNPNDPNSVYRMDLEVGKVVDEWKIHDDIPITYFTPEDVS
jgi:VID27 C-terminal WD40-like domain/VID27 PH-like domain/VID27 N-terminal region